MLRRELGPMFDFFKKKAKEYYDVIGAPIKGEAVPSAEVNDPTFAEEMLGKGMTIKPAEGKTTAKNHNNYPDIVDNGFDKDDLKTAFRVQQGS